MKRLTSDNKMLGYELMKVNNVYMADAETLCVEGAFGTLEEMEEGGLEYLTPYSSSKVSDYRGKLESLCSAMSF